MIATAAVRARLRNVAPLGALLVLLAGPAAAEGPVCQRWNVSGAWSAIQDNGSHADFTVTQGDVQILGDATFTKDWNYSGNFDGTLNGSDIKFTVYWTDGEPISNSDLHRPSSIGEYSGTISPTGRITGVTFDKTHPQTRANWYSSRVMGCSKWRVPPAPKALGRTGPSGTGPAMSICERAKDAAERNSPMAGALMRQCKASGG
jgi:hypothetical protein